MVHFVGYLHICIKMDGFMNVNHICGAPFQIPNPSVRLSVCLSVRPSVCLYTFHYCTTRDTNFMKSVLKMFN